jgi:hypothetical protein
VWAVAADLRAGRIDAARAVERLVDDAALRIGRAVTPAQRAEMRAALLKVAGADPWLSARLRDLES